MVNLKLIFIRNPVFPGQREVQHLDAGPTVAEHIAPILRLWPDTDFAVSINGHQLLCQEWGTLVPGDDDSLVLHPVLGKGASNFFRTIFDVAMMALGASVLAPLGGASSFMKGVWGAVGSYVGGRVANAILPPPKQDFKSQEQSTTYGWNGPQPTAEPGTPVAKTYGTVRIAPVLLARFVTSDGNNQYLNLLYSGGEGPVDSVEDILIDGNPIGNYKDVVCDIRLGTNEQEPIPNFNDTITDYRLGYELNTAGDWSTQTTVGTAAQGLQLTLEFPGGLGHIQDDGSLGSASVTVEAQYRRADEVGWRAWSLKDGGVVRGSQNTTMWATFRLDDLEPGQYVVRVRCAGKSGTSTRDTTRVFWTMLSEIIYQDFAYPNRVLVGIKALATSQLSNSDPSVTWKQTRSTVFIWNPYTQEYQTQRASNPYWACYDLIHQGKRLMNVITGQYEYVVDGNQPARIDFAAFAAAAAYADGQVGGDYRFNLNIYLSEGISFWDALARFAITGRGTVIPKGTQYSCICDRPSDPVQLFTVGNIAAKSFKGDFQSTRDRATSIEVTFYNKAREYSADQAVYYGPDYEASAVVANPVQATYYGITDYKHAYAEAAYLSRCNQYLVRTESWETDIDAIACTLGDVVDVQHDIPKWGLAGGRIATATPTSITLDKPVTLAAGVSYAIKFRLATDEIVTVPVLSYGLELTSDTISVPLLAEVPERYDVYALGPVGKETKPFKITAISKSGDQKVKVTGIEYVPAVYEESISAPVVNYSLHDASPVEVTGLNVAQETYRQKDGTILSSLSVSWAVPRTGFVTKYNVWCSSDDGETWLLWAGGTQSSTATITGVKVHATYLVKVATINGAGVASAGVVAPPVYVTGKNTPPAPVQGLTYREVLGGFLLSWHANNEPDIAGYNVYQGDNGASMGGSVVVAQLIMTTSLFVPIEAAGTYAFHVEAVDTSGNPSPVPTTVLASFSLPADVTGFDVVRQGDNLSFMWQPVPGAAAYELRRGSWAKGQRVGRSTNTQFTCLFPTPGDHDFYIKAIDSYGNYSANAQNASVVIVDAGGRNAVIAVDPVATGWPGVSMNTYVSQGGLQLADGAVRGQHIIEVDLGKSFTARNTILAGMIGVADTDITWGDANFTWADVEAQAPWEADGDITGVTLENQISLYTGLPPDIIESIPLDGSAAGDKGTPALEAVNVTHDHGRFKQGAFVGDLTRLSWAVDIPETFNTVFSVAVNQPTVDSVVFLTLRGNSGYLMVGYDPELGFFLQDNLGNKNTVRAEFKQTDWLSIGIAQNATTRKLFVSSFSTGAVGASEMAFGPVGGFTAAFLYPKLS